MLERAIGNPNADTSLVLKLRDIMHPDVKLTENMVLAAAQRGKFGADMLDLISKFGTDNMVKGDVQATSRVFREALINSNKALIEFLLIRMNLEIPQLGFWPLLSVSLEPPTHLGLGPNAQLAHVSSETHSSAMSPTGSVRKPELSDKIVDEWTANCLEMILKDKPPSWRDSTKSWHQDAHDLADRLVSFWGPRVLNVLFDVANGAGGTAGPAVSGAVVVKAAKNTMYGHELLPFLEGRSENQEHFVEDDVLQAAAEYGDIRTIYFFFGPYPLGTYSKAFRLAAARNSDVSVVEFLYRRISSDSIGLEELEAAAGNSDVAFECLVSHRNRSQPVVSNSLGLVIADNCRQSSTLRKAFDLRLAREPENSSGVEDLVRAAPRPGIGMASRWPDFCSSATSGQTNKSPSRRASLRWRPGT